MVYERSQQHRNLYVYNVSQCICKCGGHMKRLLSSKTEDRGTKCQNRETSNTDDGNVEITRMGKK
jgi:hypothetical protein